MLKRALRMGAAMLCTTLFTTGAIWAADPLLGTWNLNLAKSHYNPGPAPKAETRVYEAQDGGIRVIVKTVESDGHSVTVHIAANYDGKDYLVSGSSDYDAIQLKRVDDQTVEAKLLHAGKLFATGTREISVDGKTLTVTYKTAGARSITRSIIKPSTIKRNKRPTLALRPAE